MDITKRMGNINAHWIFLTKEARALNIAWDYVKNAGIVDYSSVKQYQDGEFSIWIDNIKITPNKTSGGVILMAKNGQKSGFVFLSPEGSDEKFKSFLLEIILSDERLDKENKVKVKELGHDNLALIIELIAALRPS